MNLVVEIDFINMYLCRYMYTNNTYSMGNLLILHK